MWGGRGTFKKYYKQINKNNSFCSCLEGPRIRIRISNKTSRIRNTDRDTEEKKWILDTYAGLDGKEKKRFYLLKNLYNAVKKNSYQLLRTDKRIIPQD